jgi:hypothetical protein
LFKSALQRRWFFSAWKCKKTIQFQSAFKTAKGTLNLLPAML